MRIERISLQLFSAMQDDWEQLLENCDCDPLFLSWNWMFSWWQQYSKQQDELLLLGAYDSNDSLVGLAPLYFHYEQELPLIPKLKRLELIGTRKGGFNGFRTEYLELIAHRDFADEIHQAFYSYIYTSLHFDEVYLQDIIVGSTTELALQRESSQHPCYCREQSTSISYNVDTTHTFDEYVKGLGKNSRLQLFNRRKNLNALGELTVEHFSRDNFESILPLLTSFHSDRWEKNIDYTPHMEFVKRLCQHPDIEPTGVVLKLDEKVIGVTFDIYFSNRVYNIQVGFSDLSENKISMGMITLGYAIEAAFANPKIHHYDLLAGTGKASNYKSRIASEGASLTSKQYVRSSLYKALYKIKDLRDSLQSKEAA